MKTKPPKSENKMGKATWHMLIGFYIGDMQRRNCRPDSITTNRRVLERSARSLAPSGVELRLLDVTEEKVKDYVTNLQSRQRKRDNHPYHPPIAESLSPFTVRKDVKILRGFGTWLAREGFANPFEDVVVATSAT